MYIHSEDISDVQYVMDRVRVKVKAIGVLSSQEDPEAAALPPGEGKSTAENQDKPTGNDMDVTKVSHRDSSRDRGFGVASVVFSPGILEIVL